MCAEICAWSAADRYRNLLPSGLIGGASGLSAVNFISLCHLASIGSLEKEYLIRLLYNDVLFGSEGNSCQAVQAIAWIDRCRWWTGRQAVKTDWNAEGRQFLIELLDIFILALQKGRSLPALSSAHILRIITLALDRVSTGILLTETAGLDVHNDVLTTKSCAVNDDVPRARLPATLAQLLSTAGGSADTKRAWRNHAIKRMIKMMDVLALYPEFRQLALVQCLCMTLVNCTHRDAAPWAGHEELWQLIVGESVQ